MPHLVVRPVSTTVWPRRSAHLLYRHYCSSAASTHPLWAPTTITARHGSSSSSSSSNMTSTASSSSSASAAAPRPIVISGPSGAGKSTIIKRLDQAYPGRFGFSVSHTTRGPRAGELDGREYHFTTADAFAALVDRDGFIEHAQFGGNRYGTSVETIRKIQGEGKVPLLDIEMEGVKQIKRHPEFGGGRARFLFISPPSEEVLERRLRGRGTDKEEAILKRLATAKKEMEFSRSGAHDRIVVNDDLDTAYEEVRKFIVDEA